MPIIRLLFLRGPSNISWFIITVIVNAVQRKFGVRTWPNVLNKSGETIYPLRIHRNSTSAITGKITRFRIKASLFGVFPSSQFFSCSIISIVSMRRVRIPSPAAAAFSDILNQSIGSDERFITATTKTFPISFTMTSLKIFGHLQSPKRLVTKVYKFIVFTGRRLVSHLEPPMFILVRAVGELILSQRLVFYSTNVGNCAS